MNILPKKIIFSPAGKKTVKKFLYFSLSGVEKYQNLHFFWGKKSSKFALFNSV